MSKKLFKALAWVTLAALIAVGAINAIPAQTAQAAGLADGQPASLNGKESIIQPQVVTGVLSAAEAASLKFMVEEEKLARDVYLALYQMWGLPVFQNISSSEQVHMNAISQLITRYGVTNPVQAAPGKFTDPALQSLYTQLVARGSASIGEALKVGGLIEEIDILDLQVRIQETSHADIQQVYTNLLRGSYNHLQAFSGMLMNQTGETYQPQKLSSSAYQAIVSSSSRGGAGSQNGRGRRGGG